MADSKAVAAVSTAVTSDDPTSLPQGPILFFDGGCALCHGAVRRLLRWERAGQLTAPPIRFAPLDGPTAAGLRDRGQLPDTMDAVVLWRTGQALEGEAAVGGALEVIGRPGWARAFQWLPRPLRSVGYRFTARNRQRWFGRVPDECPLPGGPGRMLP